MGKKINPMGIAVVIFAVLLITVTAIRITGLGTEFFNPLGKAMDRVFVPMERVIWNIGDSIKDNFRAIFRFRVVKAENEELQRQVDKLTGDNLQLKQQVLAALRYEEFAEKVFESPTFNKLEKIGASVVNRNPTAWYHTVTVNRGSADGVKINDAVIGNLGLVGKVIAVSGTSSDVLLILDGEGQAGALVRDSMGRAISGIVQGTYRKTDRLNEEGQLVMAFRQEDEINIGDIVFTSGLGGIYPKGIPIGIITSLKLDASALLKNAYIEPIVNFDSLEEVYIVKMPEVR
ncbi:MAG: rod shape-determining protein MreC [Gracilibacter sp. BRH_c7a]|nr:MAG: rod shape-determining protein MreC [Gracilibacter sp. BRH_c7a]